ncbi:DUF2474 domain-containing protein [Consotaella aegiceratis]
MADGDRPRPGSRLSRILWFIGLWVAGVLVVGVVAAILRAVLL